jgi:hypothetical protein
VNPGLASRLAHEHRRDLAAGRPSSRHHRRHVATQNQHRPVATKMGVILIRVGGRMAGPEVLRDGHLAALLSVGPTMTVAERNRHS